MKKNSQLIIALLLAAIVGIAFAQSSVVAGVEISALAALALGVSVYSKC